MESIFLTSGGKKRVITVDPGGSQVISSLNGGSFVACWTYILWVYFRGDLNLSQSF